MIGNESISRFFAHNDFFIDEKVAFLKFTNSYKVYDSGGTQIGVIEQSMPAWYKVLSFLISKSLFPLRLDIRDMDGNILVSVKRGWTFFMSKMQVLDGDGGLIAFIKQKFQLLKPSFLILDPDEKEVAVIGGDWKAWNFAIYASGGDAGQKQIGTITKKWNGVLKEILTTADKYIVSVNPDLEVTQKIPILAAAITIDMVLKESN